MTAATDTGLVPMRCAALAAGCGEVRLDRIVAGAYAATVEVDGPQGMARVDAGPAMRSTSRS